VKTVTISRQISGTRNGQPWPAPGQPANLPDGEADGLVALGMATIATPAAKPAPVERQETRTVEPVRRAARPPRTAKK
jgi:hypothetical protein